LTARGAARPGARRAGRGAVRARSVATFLNRPEDAAARPASMGRMDDPASAVATAATPLADLFALVAGSAPAAEPDLDELAALDADELASRLGVARDAGLRLSAAFELGRRRAAAVRAPRPALDSPAAVFAYARPTVRDLRVEVFRVLVLDARNRLIHDEIVSQGVLTASLVHPREVLRPVLVRSGAAFVVVHNHPSGDPAPSREDDRVTERLRRAGELLGASLLDHVVLGDAAYWSYRERGLLNVTTDGADVAAEEPLP
jgi:DNA repair protein RadC